MRAKITRADRRRITVQISGKTKIFFDFDEGFSPALDDRSLSDFLVRIAFGAAFSAGVDLEVEVTVDARLARNLEKFATAWGQHRPHRYGPSVRIVAPSYVDSQPVPTKGFVAAFSGGYDSSYMIARHAKPDGPSPFPPISSAVMINGFGYDLDEPRPYEMALASGRAFCSSVGVAGLHSVNTNWSEIVGPYQVLHALGISALLGLKSDVAAGGYIGLDFTAAEEFRLGPWGNSDGGNRLFSSSGFEIVPLGNDAPRLSKILHLRNAGLDRHIVVCNVNGRIVQNCGRCEKCLRTLLSYRALGIGPHDGQFDAELAEASVSAIEIKEATQRIFYRAMERGWLDRSDPYLAIVQGLLDKAKAPTDAAL